MAREVHLCYIKSKNKQKELRFKRIQSEKIFKMTLKQDQKTFEGA